MTGCKTCDMHGPGLPGIVADSIELHRALHDFGRAVLDALHIPWLVDRLARVLARG